jgi:hypothetical protein
MPKEEQEGKSVWADRMEAEKQIRIPIVTKKATLVPILAL